MTTRCGPALWRDRGLVCGLDQVERVLSRCGTTVAQPIETVTMPGALPSWGNWRLRTVWQISSATAIARFVGAGSSTANFRRHSGKPGRPGAGRRPVPTRDLLEAAISADVP